MGQVRILVEPCVRHAITSGLAHRVATQGTHLQHTEVAASVNRTIYKNCARKLLHSRRRSTQEAQMQGSCHEGEEHCQLQVRASP